MRLTIFSPQLQIILRSPGGPAVFSPVPLAPCGKPPLLCRTKRPGKKQSSPKKQNISKIKILNVFIIPLFPYVCNIQLSPVFPSPQTHSVCISLTRV